LLPALYDRDQAMQVFNLSKIKMNNGEWKMDK